MDRRNFHRICSGLIAAAATLHTLPGSTRAAAAKGWPRSALVFSDKKTVTLESLEKGDSFVFSYPYRTTPCFLIRLDQSAPANGSWPGGLGSDQSVVAFSAICSHKMSHPAKPISHITFRPETIEYMDQQHHHQSAAGLITCCSEHSVFDPAKNGAVLSGPAPTPLAAIALEADSDGHIYAVGSIGPDQYERFLDEFGFRLAMEYDVSDARTLATERTLVTPAGEFSDQQIRC
jgi:Rieske Fe-S protein